MNSVTKINYRNPSRWYILFLFAQIAGISQFLLLSFAPLIGFLQNEYQVSELTASLHLLVFPLFYVIFSIHSGSMVDNRGYKYTIGFGSLFMVVGACLRIYTDNFWVPLAGSFAIAIGQPYILNSITKLVSDWFGKDESALATGIGTCGLFLGMGLGMAITPLLVETIGFQQTMLILAGVTITGTIGFMVIARVNGTSSESAFETTSTKAMKILFQKI